MDCHKAVHNHGVGKASGWSTLFEKLKTDAEILFKEGATNKEVAKACDISYATASHWRKKLGRGLPRHIGKPGKIYSVSLDRALNSRATARATEFDLSVGDYIRELIMMDTEIGEKKVKRGLMRLEKSTQD